MKNKAIGFIVAACASASLMGSAHVKAAEKASPSISMPTAQASTGYNYVLGLEARLNTEDTIGTGKAKTGFINNNGVTSYINSFGQKVTGLLEEDGKEYLFDDQGDMVKGFAQNDGQTYYFDEQTGEKKTGTIEEDGKTYILGDQGQTQTGWIEKDGVKYYAGEDGSLLKNTTVETAEGRYLLDENGAMVTNASQDGWKYGEDGKGVQEPDLSASAGHDAIAQAALAQLGKYQDCTMLVTNSLAAVGINFHGAPLKYLSLGPTTNNPVPGDICVYQGHVAIYIGDGKAVHGGWLGNQTVVSTVACDRAFVAYVHPTLP